MRFLLDTHALLWAWTDPSQLGAEAIQVLRDPQQTLVVSAASAWEIATKQRRGRLFRADAVVASYARHVRRLGAEPLPITDEHALLAGRLDWEHRDPFDRMLVAQAMTESLTLVTRDAAFAGVPGVRVLW